MPLSVANAHESMTETLTQSKVGGRREETTSKPHQERRIIMSNHMTVVPREDARAHATVLPEITTGRPTMRAATDDEKRKFRKMNEVVKRMMGASGNATMTAREVQVFLIIATTGGLTKTAITIEMGSTKLQPIATIKVTKAVNASWSRHISMEEGKGGVLHLTQAGEELRTELFNLINS